MRLVGLDPYDGVISLLIDQERDGFGFIGAVTGKGQRRIVQDDPDHHETTRHDTTPLAAPHLTGDP